MSVFDAPSTQRLIQLAIEEDFGRGDVTSELMVDATLTSSANLVAREELRVCGVEIIAALIRGFKFEIAHQQLVREGEDVAAQTKLLELKGRTREILALERTLLNFVQHLSGIATLTREFVKLLPREIKLLDTRKTIPGWRMLEKYAVLVGGGSNHRTSLGDMILVKNNHIDAYKSAGSGQDLGQMISSIAANKPKWCCLEVEVRTLEELNAILSDRIDVVMLDNMSLDIAAQAIQIIRQRTPNTKVEVSGGVTLQSIGQIAELKPDYISVGAITRASPSVDISLSIKG